MRQVGKRCALACGLALVAVACSREPEPAPAAPTQTFTPAAGTAQPPGPRCAENFKVFDADSDGQVSRAEFLAHPHPHGDAEHIFAARDANGDGMLTQAEFCFGAGHGMGPGMRGRHMGPGMGPGRMGPMGPGMAPQPAQQRKPVE